MIHPLIRYLPFGIDVNTIIYGMRCLDVWKGKVRRLNREYRTQWRLRSGGYLENKEDVGLVNYRKLSEMMVQDYEPIYKMHGWCPIDRPLPPNYLHAILYP